MTSDPDLRTLDRFVGDHHGFAAHHWGIAPLVRRTGDDFTDLFSIQRVELMLVQAGRLPTFRLVRDGKPLDPKRYCTTERLGGRAVEDVADIDRVAHEVAAGATVVMQGLQRTDLTIAALCRSLERAVSHPVQANAYLSPSNATGLAEHADDHDVLAVQIIGTKQWNVEQLGLVTTQPGDVVYLPAGVRHAAATSTSTSLHLTIGIVRVTRRAALVRMLDEVTALDEPLPLGYGRPENADELAGSMSDTLLAAVAGLQSASAAQAVASEQDRVSRRRPPLGIGRLSSLLGSDEMTHDSRLICRHDPPLRIHDGDGSVHIEVPGKRIRFPKELRPALEHLVDARSAEVGSLPGLSPTSQLVLARRLAREGIVTWD